MTILDMLSRRGRVMERAAESGEWREAEAQREWRDYEAERAVVAAAAYHRDRYPEQFDLGSPLDAADYAGQPVSVILARAAAADRIADKADAAAQAQREADVAARYFHLALTRPSHSLAEILRMAADPVCEHAAVLPPAEPPPRQLPDHVSDPVSRARRQAEDACRRQWALAYDETREMAHRAQVLTGHAYTLPEVASWVRVASDCLGQHRVRGTSA